MTLLKFHSVPVPKVRFVFVGRKHALTLMKKLFDPEKKVSLVSPTKAEEDNRSVSATNLN